MGITSFSFLKIVLVHIPLVSDHEDVIINRKEGDVKATIDFKFIKNIYK